jgi:hypothetical protein
MIRWNRWGSKQSESWTLWLDHRPLSLRNFFSVKKPSKFM